MIQKVNNKKIITIPATKINSNNLLEQSQDKQVVYEYTDQQNSNVVVSLCDFLINFKKQLQDENQKTTNEKQKTTNKKTKTN